MSRKTKEQTPERTRVTEILKSFFLFSGEEKYQRYLLGFLIAVGIIGRAFVWHNQPAAYLDDDIGHFLVARDAWIHPQLIFSFWGRAVFTLLYMPLAPFGWPAARLISFLSSTLTIFFAVHVARRLGLKSLFLIPLLLDLQPWFLEGSHQMLTEIPVMLFMIAALFFALNERLLIAALLIGLLPLIRHEAIALTGLWILYSIHRRSWKALAVTCFPLLTANLLAYGIYGLAPIGAFLEPSRSQFYGRGEWGHFVFETIRLAGLPVSILAAIGVGSMLRSWSKFLSIAWYGSLLIVNAVIFRYGLYSSGGFGIFLLPLAPMIAISALAGSEFLWKRGSRFGAAGNASRYGARVILSLLLLASISVAVLAYKPKPASGDSVEMKEVAEYVRYRQLDTRHIAAMNVWFYYHLPLEIPYMNQLWNRVLWSSNQLDALDVGDILVWDRHYSDRWGHIYDELSSDVESWRQLKIFQWKGETFAAVFEKVK